MVVDDDEPIRYLIGSFLEKDYNIEYKGNGQEALEFLQSGENIDLILLDMEMPKMNGRVFVRRVQFYPKHTTIPIILISATNSKLIINSFLKLGVVDYIVKPFKPEELVVKVGAILPVL